MNVPPKLKLAMIGGGPGAFIGAVHRKAAQLDGAFELVSGAFSSDPEKSRQTGEQLGLDPARVYGSYGDLLREETELDAVAIVTPNHLHFTPAKIALERGLHVIVDKPMTYSLEEAKELKTLVDQSGLVFALTHTYAGYPMIKEARVRVQRGELGSIRKIYVEYPQGWLSQFIEESGQKQASWRTDPTRSGAGGAVGDIGTHAAHLAEYLSGQKIAYVNGMLNTVVHGRQLDDDAAALLRFDGGATGVLVATQIAVGEENNLKIRLYGQKGGLEWSHADPNTLWLKPADQPAQCLRAGNAYLSESAQVSTRLPSGHPEGFIEAFANLYAGFARAIHDHRAGQYRSPGDYDVPGVDEGLRGMAFIETMVRSAQSEQKWIKLDLP